MKRTLFAAAIVVACGCTEDCPPSAVYAEDHPAYARYEAPDFDNTCSSDDDCFVGGCGGEVCAAEPVGSTCLVVDPAEGACGCLRGTCVWKTNVCFEPPAPVSGPDAGVDAPDAGTDARDAGSANVVRGVEVLSRLAGLWTGPATNTWLGDFAYMNVDLRPVGAHHLFGRVDLDQENGLLFLFDVETNEGEDVVVFRNGGFFLGRYREHRTTLVESADDDWRFCHAEEGCAYLEAHFALDDDALVLDVLVRGSPHLHWEARRAEDRTTPDPFPATLESQGDGTTPPLPTQRVQVRWAAPLAAEADVWVLMATTACLVPSECVPARAGFVRAPAGATDATVAFDTIHPARYYATALVDRNQNFVDVFFPDSGDGISIPNARVDVGEDGGSATVRIVATAP